MKKNDIGIIGLAVMGRSLALNMADHGYAVAGYNRSYEVTKQMCVTWPHEQFTGYQTLQEFVDSLATPRKIMLMVKAGNSVDLVLEQLLPLLQTGDIILDGGNSFFQDTIRREAAIKAKGIYYFGVGVSGGESGARFGPSIMPGGDAQAYEKIRTLLESIAAKAKDGVACCAYIGENGAGHYVKMVHNGIEYADMQIIAEAYLLLKHVGQLDNQAIATVFQDYDQGELNSFLVRITGEIFQEQDDLKDGDLIDQIKDVSSHKGTGKWTSEEALHVGVDVSMITSAFHARIMSGSENRTKIQERYGRPAITAPADRETFIQQVKEGMYAAKIIAYAQGFDLLKKAALQYGWNLAFDRIASIFRAGCIIQAQFLDDITNAYNKDKQVSHLLLDNFFAQQVTAYEASLRDITAQGIVNGIPIPALSNAIAYLDLLKAEHVGANLIQAQRDYFGAHTFERVDQAGSFHHEWGK